MSLTGAAALQAALAGEHAANYAYGVIGAHLTGNDLALAQDSQTAHQHRRDSLVTQLTAAGVIPQAASAAYKLPFAVTTGADGRRLAVTLEERLAGLWRAAVPATQGADRQAAVQALTETAVRATQWRQRATPNSPATVAFPGS
ncbi:hypothetical protein GCM10009765_33480 [Fodinicola feengrottensis]|uniref:DUF4439 domain-containing protein n=1 Tax=Fodinicola feengrottensis TaxID=435914 RepID=A0ABN2H456_9ACTN